jgi:hypothetical protein
MRLGVPRRIEIGFFLDLTQCSKTGHKQAFLKYFGELSTNPQALRLLTIRQSNLASFQYLTIILKDAKDPRCTV